VRGTEIQVVIGRQRRRLGPRRNIAEEVQLTPSPVGVVPGELPAPTESWPRKPALRGPRDGYLWGLRGWGP